MRKIVAGAGLAALVALMGPATAQAQQVDVTKVSEVPAATLLLPYFEVNYGQLSRMNTVLTIANASATAVLGHVTIWSDAGMPVLAFNVYFTGYDVQEIDLGALIAKGTLPRTASAGQDPGDQISPHGDFSQDINFASCSGQLPFTQLPGDYIQHVQGSLTGRASAFYGGRCSGINHGDSVARGYLTIDSVNNCTLRFPGEPGYFVNGGGGDATNQNVFWGEYRYVEKSKGRSQTMPMVHVVASPTDPETSVAGEYTFYGRGSAFTAADNRQPLVTTVGARYATDTIFNGGTDLAVWRDSKVPFNTFVCGTNPAWYPLSQESIIAFDDQEGALAVSGTPFPAVAQRVHVGGSALPVPASHGWLHLNLSATVAAAGSNPPEDPAAAQAWVTTTHRGGSATKQYNVGSNAVPLDSATAAGHVTPN